ncbi:39S ribosomal protein L2, mitochondrial-like [Actinia tenebrosa]|uniref:39S ribosomal protein L2, mitochondrial-like n=1 Tax=Actinia tenebrosa TaxID=6105 RepID=A0A6P8ICV9_ACTTE|nr:39S ribosomal protein L2, mitochondrial-like [Actinia tenebrosa]
MAGLCKHLVNTMASRLNSSYWFTIRGLAAAVSNSQVSAFSTSSPLVGRTHYSFMKIPRSIPNMPVPRYLKDGTMRRHKGRSGRNHSGKISIRHRGGGHSQTYRIIDFVRAPFMKGAENPPLIKEKVLQVGYDPCRSARIALVAGNGSNRQKLLIAPDTVQVGDIVTSHRGKPESLALLKPGDAYPLKYLPIGTVVHNIELKPGKGAQLARAAGTSAQLIRKSKDTAVVRLPSKEEKVISDLCMASVGRVSNIDRKNRVIGKAGRNRWLNRRPKGQTGIDRTHWKKKRV